MSSPADDASPWALRRLRTMLAVAAAGLATAFVANRLSPEAIDPARLGGSAAYDFAVPLLLAIGLFAAGQSISVRQLRDNTRVVLLAITVGVAAKAALTGAVMLAVYHDPGYLLFGIAVAQIDPLSVAMMLKRSGMSPRAKSILTAWASFDDPVTILLTAYLAAPLLRGHHSVPTTGTLFVSAGLRSYLLHLAFNALLVLGALAVRFVLARVPDGRGRQIAGLVLIVTFLAVAAAFALLPGIAVVGLVFRPATGVWLDRAVSAAFWFSAFLIGVFLIGGADLPAGVLLGVTAFGVQILVGSAIGIRLSRDDRVHLALGQQNGLTAISLALALQPFLPASVKVIGVAVLVINAMYIGANELRRRRWPAWNPVGSAAFPGPATMADGEEISQDSRRAALQAGLVPATVPGVRPIR